MTRRVVIVTFEGAQGLDVVGPADVLHAASLLGADPAYETVVVGPSAGTIRLANGLELVVRDIGSLRGPIDTLLVAGGIGSRAASRDRRLLRAVSRIAGRARRVTSVCTGAFVLAECGLLDGRRATTHWASCDELARRHPAIDVERDPIFVRDGELWTSAGVTAGMDLTLALVADDHGPELARQVAQWLVLYLQRPGGQAQFSAHLAAPQPVDDELAAVRGYIAENLDADLSVPALARRANLSERHFARTFAAACGMPPGELVSSLRLERACQLLETTDQDAATIARSCGFGTAETLHRTFRRRLGTTPMAYRQRFAATAAPG